MGTIQLLIMVMSSAILGLGISRDINLLYRVFNEVQVVNKSYLIERG